MAIRVGLAKVAGYRISRREKWEDEHYLALRTPTIPQILDPMGEYIKQEERLLAEKRRRQRQ